MIDPLLMPSLCISLGHSAVSFPCSTHFARLFHNRWGIGGKGNFSSSCFECCMRLQLLFLKRGEVSVVRLLPGEVGVGRQDPGHSCTSKFQAGYGGQHLRGDLPQPALPDTCTSHSLESSFIPPMSPSTSHQALDIPSMHVEFHTLPNLCNNLSTLGSHELITLIYTQG